MASGLPSSSSTKSSLPRLETICPFLSRTVASSVTAFTSTEMPGGCWPRESLPANRKQTIRKPAVTSNGPGDSRDVRRAADRTVRSGLAWRGRANMGIGDVAFAEQRLGALTEIRWRVRAVARHLCARALKKALLQQQPTTVPLQQRPVFHPSEIR